MAPDKKERLLKNLVDTGAMLLEERLEKMSVNLENHPYKFEFRIKRCPAANKRFPGILLVTLPKSGSDYIWSRLFVGLNVDQVRVSSATFPDDIVFDQSVKELVEGNAVSHGHIPARSINLRVLGLYMDRLVVHLRDPRQAVLSYLHFAEQQYQKNGEAFTAVQNPELPSEFFNWNFEEKLDWYIRNCFDLWVDWIQGWLDAESNDNFKAQLLFTEYKEMKSDPEAFFSRILDFYQIERDEFSIDLERKLKEGQLHFRKGSVDEWKGVFSSELIDFTNERIPEQMKHRFGWV